MTRIIFDWIINYECNYRCPYCWFNDQWEELKRFNQYIQKEQMIECWRNIYQKYGCAQRNISGGEPFIYYNFADLILELLKFHRIEIITNLSLDIDYLIDKVDPSALEIVPSFHPLFSDFGKFKQRAILLKENRFIRKISYLAWPPLIPELNYYKDQFTKLGFNFFARPFFGIYNGKKYPDMYTDEEKTAILDSVMPSGDMPSPVEPIITKGKLCRAGEKYALIQPDGKIYRCGAQKLSDSQQLIIGHVLDENFRLYDKPQPCDAQECICNMWTFLMIR